MRWLCGLLVGGLLGVGCGKTVYRSHEGHYCSSTANDDPFFECSPSYDLVCINTYAEQVRSTGGQEPRFQDIWLCRLACENADDSCPDAKDRCCKGDIYGRNYGKQRACVPAGLCQTEDLPDAGPVVRRDSATDTPTDTATDGPEQDGPQAAPSDNDAAAGDGAAASDAGTD
jgi:hypothetical protein